MKKNGFTLIELLAVIIILAIIMVISIPVILNVVEKSRVNSVKLNAMNVRRALIDQSYLEVSDINFDNNGQASLKLRPGTSEYEKYVEIYNDPWGDEWACMIVDLTKGPKGIT